MQVTLLRMDLYNIKRSDVPRITDYDNQYFELNKVVFVNSRRIADFSKKSKIHKDNYFHFKLLVDVLRNPWHLCKRSIKNYCQWKYKREFNKQYHLIYKAKNFHLKADIGRVRITKIYMTHSS